MSLGPGFRLALGLIVGLCCGCSSFEKRWKTAANSSTATRWEGRWTSEKHVTSSGAPSGGRLRAVLEPAADRRLTAHFRANWIIFASEYQMMLEPKPPVPRGGPVREFRGTQELPKMFGGTYRYDARIAGDQFTARYDSSYDHGTFVLSRLHPKKDFTPVHARH